MGPGIVASLISYTLISAVVLSLCAWLLRRRQLTVIHRTGIWILITCALVLPATAFIGDDECRSFMALSKHINPLDAPELFLGLIAVLGVALRLSRGRKGIFAAIAITGGMLALFWLLLAECSIKTLN
jgi:hypothetical protein